MFWLSLHRLLKCVCSPSRRGRRPERRRRVAWFRPRLEYLEDRTLLATATWINAAGGAWNVASNWSTGALPGSADDAVINIAVSGPITYSTGTSTIHSLTDTTAALVLSGGSLSLAAGSSISQAFTLSGGTLGGAGNLMVAGDMIWTSGTMTGAGHTIFSAGSTLAINATAAKSLSGRTVDNSGTMTWTGGQLLTTGGAWNNQAGGVFDVQADVAWAAAGGTATAINNAGTFKKSAGTGTASFAGAVNNNAGGTFTVQTGTLSLAGGGSLTGTLTASAGSTLSLSGALTVGGGALTLSGAGTYNLAGTVNNSGATLTLDGSAGGTFNLSSMVTGGTVVTANGAKLIGVSGGLNGVTLNGDMNLGVTGQGQTVAVTNGLTLNGTVTIGSGMPGSGANYGALLITGTQTLAGTGTVVLNSLNYYDALAVVTGGTTLTIGPGVTVRGSGVIGADTFTWGTASNVAFVNQGTIQADVAGQQISVYGTGWSNPGTVRALNGASLFLYGTNWTNSGTLSITGGGSLSLNVDQTDAWVNTGVINATNSTVNFGGTFTTVGTFNRSGGTVYLSGKLNNAGRTLALNAATGSWILSSFSLPTAINDGTITTTGGAKLIASPTDFEGVTLNGVTLNGDLEVQAAAYSSQNVAVTNGLTLNGTLTIKGPTYTNGGLSFVGTQTLAGTGTVVFADTGANYLFASGLTISAGITIHGGMGTLSGSFVNHANIVENTGNEFLDLAGANWSNTGTIHVENGTSMDILGTGTDSAPIILGNGSYLQINGGGFTFQAGSRVTGPGTLILHGVGTSTAPLLLEVSSEDLGLVTAGFNNSYLLGRLWLAGTSFVRLVDNTHEQPGPGPEALYLNNLTVEGNANLDLNALHLYTRAQQIDGTVIGGVVNLLLDLVVQSVTVPATGVAGRSATISWMVTNQSSQPVTGTWQDALFISTSATLDPSAQLLAVLPHSGPLAPGATYTGSVTIDLPGLLPGPYYFIAQTDRRGQVDNGQYVTNNQRASTTMALTIPSLALGTPLADQFTRAGEARYYQVNVAAGNASLVLTLNSAATVGANELYVSRGAIPSPSAADFLQANPSQPNQELIIPTAVAGTYYILLSHRAQYINPEPYTLTAREPGLGIRSVSPNSGANIGPVTVAIRGTDLTNPSQVLLMRGGTTAVQATAIQPRDASLLYATFDLTGQVPGLLDLRVVNGSQTTTAVGAFTVVSGVPCDPGASPVRVTLLAPAQIRQGERATLTINYTNTCSNDVPAPVFLLTSNTALLRLPGESTGGTSRLLVGVNPLGGPADILPAGAQGSIPLEFDQPDTISVKEQSNPNAPFDWGPVTTQAVPPNMTPERWASKVATASSRIGTTWGDVVRAALAGKMVAPNSPGPVVDLQRDVVETVVDYNYPDVTTPPLRIGTPVGTELASGPPQGPHIPGFSYPFQDFPVTLYRVGDYVTDPSARTIVITHGWKGLFPNDRNQVLAQTIKQLCPNVNVYYLDWSEGAVSAPFPDPAANNVEAAARAATQLLQSVGALPGQMTLIGESFGTYVNYNIARNFALARAGLVDRLIAFSPANERGGYLPPDMTRYSRFSIAFHTNSIGDTRFHVAAFDLVLQTRPEDNFDYGLQHTFGMNWMIDCLLNHPDLAHPCGLLDLGYQDFVKMGFHKQLLPIAYDGTAHFDCSYDPTPAFLPPIPTFTPINLPGLFNPVADAEVRLFPLMSHDPNDIIGPAGFGTQSWLAPAPALPYTIHFENAPPEATAPAQEVFVTNPLGANLDWSTFQVGSLGWGSTMIQVQAGLQSFQTSVNTTNQDGSPLRVDIQAGLNLQTGVVTWSFRSVDPVTGEFPFDRLDGFLPVNDATHRGEAFVNYTVRPKANLATGARLDAAASIVFDVNAPVATAPIFNTIDAAPPASRVNPLPATTSTASFTVSWSGTDDPGGSGVGFYDILVSDNGGPFMPFLTRTTQTSATFTGVSGHTYGFYSIATDNVGNRQPTPAAAQATTTVQVQTQSATSTALTSDHPGGSIYGQFVTFTATVSAAAGTPTGSVQFQIDGANFGGAVTLNNGAAQISTATLSAGTHSVTAAYTSNSSSFPNSATTSPLVQTVSPAPLTVTADNKTKVYGTTNPTFTATYVGFVLQQGPGALGGTLAFTTTATATSHVGGYTVTPGGLTATNYAITFVSGTLTVTPAPLTVTADSLTRLYGQANPAFTYTFTGFVNGDTVGVVNGSPALGTAAAAASPVGTYAITAAAGTLSDADYSFIPANGTLTINKAHLTVTADNQSRLYGDPNPVLTATLTGFQNGETLATSGVTGSPALSTAATSLSTVGTYTISVSQGTLAAGNYDFTVFSPGTLTVTPAPLTVTGADAARLYGDPNPAFTGTVVGVKNNDAISATFATAATPDSAVGSYAIVPTLIDPANRLGNYSVTVQNGTLTVKPAPLPVTAADATRTYGSPNPTFTGTLAGVKNNDNITALYTTAATPASDVGAYAITPTLLDPNNRLGNYAITLRNGTLTVTKAHLTVTANDLTVIYRAPNPARTYTLTGFVLGQTLATSGVAGAPALSSAYAASSGVGTYPIAAAVGTLAAKNYDFPTLVPGTLTVTYAVKVLFDQNQAKHSGSTLPVEIQLTDYYGNNVSSSGIGVHASYIAAASNPSLHLPADSPGNSQSGGDFKLTGDSYHYNLKTTGLAAGTYSFFFTVDGDPLAHMVSFIID
jgi:hypothetical protein